MKHRYFLYLFLLIYSTSCTSPLFVTKKNLELYVVIEDGKTGYINQKGKLVIPLEYDVCESLEEYWSFCTLEFHRSWDEEGLVVIKNGVYLLLNSEGKKMNKEDYSFIENHDIGSFRVSKNNKYGVISATGEILVPIIFDSQYFLDSENIFPGKIDGQMVLYNPKNQNIMEMDFANIGPFINDRAEVRTHHQKYGMIDTNGVLLLDTVYDEVGLYMGGLIAVKQNGNWHYIDILGQDIIPGPFTEVNDF